MVNHIVHVVNLSLLQLREFAVQAKVYPKEELFLLELCCDAGTYVKELVHGDLGRTHPSLSSLLECPVDLIALDVVAVEHDWPPKIAQQFKINSYL